MSAAQYPDSFFFAVHTDRSISCVHCLDKIYFVSITKIKAWDIWYSRYCNSTQLRMEIFFTHLWRENPDLQCNDNYD